MVGKNMFKFVLIVAMAIVLFILVTHRSRDPVGARRRLFDTEPDLGEPLEGPHTPLVNIEVLASDADIIPAKRKLPDCLIIGVRKGGTGPVEHFLSQHPQVATPGEEMYFFNTGRRYAKGLQWYQQRLPAVRPGQLLLEATAVYFYHPLAPQRVYNMSASTKLILVVMEPIQRMLNDYFYMHRHSISESSIYMHQDYLKRLVYNSSADSLIYTYKGLQMSSYITYLRRWLKYFPLHQLHLVDRVDIADKNPAGEMRRLERFLRLKPHFEENDFYFSNMKGFYCLRTTGCVKIRSEPGRLRSSPHIKNKLHAFFNPLNEQFYKAVGRNFSW